jgi:ATP-dependent helicase HrpA
MNEWFDAYEQIRRICRTIKGFVRGRSQGASYEAIHKSLLSGFYSGIACRSDKDCYNGIHVDGIRIFPTSVLFGKNPQWVLFHEIIETSRIYGHTGAVIRPEWVETMFRTKCNYLCEDTWYDPDRGVVRAREEVTFKGMLLLKNRHIDLEIKDPGRAHEVFLKDALVNELIGEGYRFIRCNRQTRDRINLLQHKLRRNLYLGDWALEEFYALRLPGVKNKRELNEKIKQIKNDSFLIIPSGELLAVNEPINENAFPDVIHVGRGVCTVSYLFSPGDPNDGAVITVSEDVFESVPTFYWEWVLPALCRLRIEIIVNEIKNQLIEISLEPEFIVDMMHAKLSSANGKFVHTISSFLYNNYHILLYPSDINKTLQTSTLWPIVKVIDRNGRIVMAKRTFLSELNSDCMASDLRHSFWEDECNYYEQQRFNTWKVAFLEPVSIKSVKQEVSLVGITALHYENGNIAVRVFFSYNSASLSHAEALRKLLEDELAEMFGWELERIVFPAVFLKKCKLIWPDLDIIDEVRALVVSRTLQLPYDLPCDETAFKLLLHESSMNISKSISEVKTALENIIDSHEIYRTLLVKKNVKYGKTYLGPIYEELCDSLNVYCAAFFSCVTPVNYCLRIPLILKEFVMRIEVAYNDPSKYRVKMKTMSFFAFKIQAMMEGLSTSFQIERKKEELMIMIEDYIISQFTIQNSKRSVGIQQSDIEEKIEELHHVLEIPEV